MHCAYSSSVARTYVARDGKSQSIEQHIAEKFYCAIYHVGMVNTIRIEREEFYPEPEFESGSLALRCSALTAKLSRTSADP